MNKIHLEVGRELEQATLASMVTAILFSCNILHGNDYFKCVQHCL